MPGPTPTLLFGAGCPMSGSYRRRRDAGLRVPAEPAGTITSTASFRDGPARYEQVGGRRKRRSGTAGRQHPRRSHPVAVYDPCLHAFVRAGKLEIL